MAYAVKLFLDQELSAQISGLWDGLKLEGISSHMSDSGYQPHITILGARDVDANRARETLVEILRPPSEFALECPAVSVFPGSTSTVFVSVTLTESLRKLHETIHLGAHDWAQDLAPYYKPGSWVPHITVGCQLNSKEVCLTVQKVLNECFPLKGRAISIALVQIPGGKKEFEIELQNAS